MGAGRSAEAGTAKGRLRLAAVMRKRGEMALEQAVARG
jgi:hypothetical protein